MCVGLSKVAKWCAYYEILRNAAQASKNSSFSVASLPGLSFSNKRERERERVELRAKTRGSQRRQLAKSQQRVAGTALAKGKREGEAPDARCNLRRLSLLLSLTHTYAG